MNMQEIKDRNEKLEGGKALYDLVHGIYERNIKIYAISQPWYANLTFEEYCNEEKKNKVRDGYFGGHVNI